MSQNHRRGRPQKKPDYDKELKNQEQLDMAVSLFVEPLDDREKRSEDAPSISSVAAAMNTTPIRVKKMLITAGYYSTATSRKVQELHNSGLSIQEIMKVTGLKSSSVWYYLPYSKGLYNLTDPTLCAEQSRLFRKRKKSCAELEKHIDAADAEDYLWKTIEAFEGYLIQTTEKLPLRYTLKDGELFFTKAESHISKGAVMAAFHKARNKDGFIENPEDLGVDDEVCASYLYAIFLRIGVCQKKDKTP